MREIAALVKIPARLLWFRRMEARHSPKVFTVLSGPGKI
jgi:hypothetical protein